MLDDIDRQIVARLMDDARVSWTDLAQQVGLSAPATKERARKLEENGTILQYTALVDPGALGLHMLAYVFVSLASTHRPEEFLEEVGERPEIQECHIIAGDYDFLLKVRCADGEHLKELLRVGIRGLPGMARTSTTIVLSTVKETPMLPRIGSGNH